MIHETTLDKVKKYYSVKWNYFLVASSLNPGSFNTFQALGKSKMVVFLKNLIWGRGLYSINDFLNLDTGYLQLLEHNSINDQQIKDAQ